MNNKTQFVFMSDGLFEHLTETEAYIFSFVAYFACDAAKGKIFRRTTASLSKNLGYSSNTVRSAIESLIKKSFLVRETPPTRERKRLKYNYIEEVSHYLKIGSHDYAIQFADWLSIMLDQLRKGTSKEYYKSNPSEVSFFKVYVTALQSQSKKESWKRNQSRHLHKALALHGYLFNRGYWSEKHFNSHFSRSVSFLSAVFQWSPNTIRRLINTLKSLGLIKYKVDDRRILFQKVNMVGKLRQGYEQLVTQLVSRVKKVNSPSLNIKTPSTTLQRPGPNATPEEHALFLSQMKAHKRV